MLHSFAEFHRRGQTGAALDVDSASLTGATRLYESVGMSLYTDFVLPFEVSSLLLLAAIVGAVVMAKRRLD